MKISAHSHLKYLKLLKAATIAISNSKILMSMLWEEHKIKVLLAVNLLLLLRLSISS
jgi:hypothetical protein